MDREFLQKAFTKLLEEKTKDQFGERNYVGASDVVKCERRFVLEKLQPVEPSFEHAITMLRGHKMEEIIRDSIRPFYNNKQLLEQLQVIDKDKNYIRATLDMVFVLKNKVVITEIKSTAKPVVSPFDSWVQQVIFQIGMLKKVSQFENKKVEGKIVTVDLNGDLKSFEVLFEQNIFEKLYNKASRIWDLWQKKDIASAISEPSLLCSVCPYKSLCKTETQNEIPVDLILKVQEYKILQQQIKELEVAVDSIKTEIIAYCGDDFSYKGQDISISITKVADSVVLDGQALKKQLPEIYNQFLKPKKGYIKLVID